MGKELERLEVVIEADPSRLKKGAADAKKSIQDMVNNVNQDIEKIKSPIKDMMDNESMSQLKNMKSYIKNTFSDLKNGNLTAGITDGIDKYIRDAQVAAGIRVYTDDYLDLEKDIEAVEGALEQMNAKRNAMSDSEVYEESKEYKELTKSISATEKRLNTLIERQEKMKAGGASHRSSGWKNLQYDIEETRKTLDAYKQEAASMQTDGSALQHSRTWNKITGSIQQAEAELRNYKAQQAGMNAAGTSTTLKNPGSMSSGSYLQTAAASVGYLPTKVREVTSSINQAIKKIPVIGRVATEASYVASKAFGGMRAVFSKVGPVIKKVSGVFGSLIQKFKSGIPIFNKTGKSMSGMAAHCRGLGGMMNTIGMTARFMFASFLIRGAVNGAKEGFQNLAQYSERTNASLSMLMSSLTQLKNALATAFAPILNVVAPLLNALIQKVTQAVSALGMLFASLTGQKSFTAAKKVNQDYAASLNQNSKNAEKADKANQKLQRTLLGFDQLNKMDDNSNSDIDTGVSGDVGGLLPADMFEEVPITSKISDLADKIKDAWRNADFTEIGQIVGNKLNAALESIPWEAIQSALYRIAKSVATFLNGFIETVDWGLVGETISQGINTAFMTANTFAQNFHWDSLGEAVGNGINGAMYGLNWDLIKETVHNVVSGLIEALNTFLRTADWNKVGETIAEFFNTKLEAFYTAVTEFDWEELGDSIAEAINGLFSTFDWAKLGESISNFAKGILDSLIHAIENTNWMQVGESIAAFLANIDWNGIVDRLFELLAAALGGLAMFLGGLIIDAVIQVGKDIQMDIQECGGNIVLGILKGIGDALLGIGQWIYDHIFTPIIDGFKAAFGIHSPSTVMEEQGGNIIEGLLNGLIGNIGSVITWFTELPGKVKEALGDAKEWLVEKGKGAIEGIKNGYEAVKDSKLFSKFKNLKDEAFSAVGNVAAKVKTKGTDIISGIKDGYENSKQSGLLSKVSTLKDYVFTSVGDMAKKVKSKGQSIISGIADGYDRDKHLIKSAVSGVGDLISKGIGNLSDVGKSAISAFARGFSSVHIPMPHIDWDWHEIGMGDFSISIPSFDLSWYAKGGFPNVGEMFVARENGPELVGRMGSKSAVANNAQIVEGVKAGVKDGVMEAMMNFQGGGGAEQAPVIEFTIIADTETLYRATQKGKQKSDRRYEVLVTV